MNQNKKNAFLKNVVTIFILLFLVLAGVEAGLHFRALLKSQFAVRNHTSNTKTVLMIGDSVLGGAEVDDSIYSELKNNLESKESSAFDLIDGVKQGNYSSQVNYTIDEMIKKHHPQMSIILLGNSDFIVLSEKSEERTYLPINYLKDFVYRSYLFKLYVSFSHYVKMNFLKKTKIGSFKKLQEAQEFREDPKSAETFQKQELLYKAFQNGTLSCPDMAKLAELRIKFLGEAGIDVLQKTEKCDISKLPPRDQFKVNYSLGRAYKELRMREKVDYYFGKAFEISPRSLGLLGHLYWRAEGEKNCSDMFKYFEEVLRQTEPRGQMIWSLRHCFTKDHKIEEGVKFFNQLSKKLKANRKLSLLIAESLSGNETSRKSIIESLSANRDNYLSMLNYYKLKSMFKEANALYLTKDLYVETNEVRIDLKNFRATIRKLLLAGGDVIVLQYPNQSDWPVLEAIAPFGLNVTFISLSSILEKNLSQYNIFQLLEDDFLHVTPLGAKIIADELNLKIRKILK